MDSEFVIRQLNGAYAIRAKSIKPLYDQVKQLESRFNGEVKYYHHSRDSDWAIEADELANEEYNKRQKQDNN